MQWTLQWYYISDKIKGLNSFVIYDTIHSTHEQTSKSEIIAVPLKDNICLSMATYKDIITIKHMKYKKAN